MIYYLCCNSLRLFLEGYEERFKYGGGRLAALQGVFSLLGAAQGQVPSVPSAPSSLGAVKDQATSFLSKAQPGPKSSQRSSKKKKKKKEKRSGGRRIKKKKKKNREE